jgi:hypothetical protein
MGKMIYTKPTNEITWNDVDEFCHQRIALPYLVILDMLCLSQVCGSIIMCCYIADAYIQRICLVSNGRWYAYHKLWREALGLLHDF